MRLSDNRATKAAGDGMTGQAARFMGNPLMEMKMRLALILCLLAAPAFAESKISTDAHVTEVLLAARVGDVIRNTCPSISARMFAVLGAMSDLKSYAVAQGYAEDEVKAFLKDPVEKDRIKGMAAAYLSKAGAKDGDVESYCVVGRDEITRQTLTGSLLRSWK
jgi:hypothetical protein